MMSEGACRRGKTLGRSCQPLLTLPPFTRILAGCGWLLLCACPQMLEDEFHNLPVDEVGDLGAAGAGADAGVGGHASGGAGGVAGVGGSAAVVQAQVVGSIPEDGAAGVLSDSALAISFSVPMNTASVEAAYASSELPAAQVAFSWSDADTVLHIQPRSPMQVATGSDPQAVPPASYTIELSGRAQDKQGNSLLARQITFSVIRSITQTLGAVLNRDLTGNWRSDSSYGLAYCERSDTTICMGDSPATGEPAYKGLVSFDLRGLPPNLRSITAAELSATVSSVYGTPFADLGELQLEHVSFTSIGDPAFSSAALSGSQVMSSAAVAGTRMSASVLADVQADWGVRDYSQYRMVFSTSGNTDGAPDLLVCDWNGARLSLTYSLP
jgi:hypothetical protein